MNNKTKQASASPYNRMKFKDLCFGWCFVYLRSSDDKWEREGKRVYIDIIFPPSSMKGFSVVFFTYIFGIYKLRENR